MQSMLPFNVWRDANADLEATVREKVLRGEYEQPTCQECDGTGMKFCHTCEYENECPTCTGSGIVDLNAPWNREDFIVAEMRRLFYAQAEIDADKWQAYQAFIKEYHGTLAA